jgi:hypothetical protein
LTWVLLIYSVPAEPSRKRAAIWREIKKSGAVYLRDGVCALPETEESVAAFQAIAEKVEEFGGQATLARSVQLDGQRTEALMTAARSAREVEYADLRREIEGFLSHVEREREHRRFSFSELDELDQDLHKLRRWSNQITARDFTRSPSADDAAQLLGRCEAEIAEFLEAAYRQEEVST